MEHTFDGQVFEEDMMSAILLDETPVPFPGRAHLRLVVDNSRRGRGGPAPMVLTARGRVVVRVLQLVAGLLAAVVLGALVGLVLRPDPAVAAGVVTIAPGESLWTVAAAVAGPAEDPRDVLEQIVALNGLSDDVVSPGQELRVPGA